MAVQPSPHKCSLLMIKNKGCPAFKPLVYFSSSKLPFKNQSKIQSKNQSRNQSKFAFFIVFLIFSFQSRNQSRNFLKTTILLKKNGFQSQIEFVQKSIVRLNFFNRGAFGTAESTFWWPEISWKPSSLAVTWGGPSEENKVFLDCCLQTVFFCLVIYQPVH